MSNFSSSSHHVLVFYSLICVVRGNGFTALSGIAWYVHELCRQEWSEDESAEMDPAAADPSTRLQICDEISRSAIFRKRGMRSVTMEEVFEELTAQPKKYAHIFHDIYSPSDGSGNTTSSHTYTNPYTLREFQVDMRIHGNVGTPFMRQRERVFVCLLREMKRIDSDSSDDYPLERIYGNFSVRMESNELILIPKGEESTGLNGGDIISIYVTKAYDLKMGLHVHRYIHLDASKFDGDELMLADRSANAYSRADFNVEMHYLELRKHTEPVWTMSADPILRFASSQDSSIRLNRICTIVTTSSCFQRKFGEVIRVCYTELLQKDISFRTDEGKRGADGKQYYEFMVTCRALMYDRRLENVYISRAYNPLQVFLYFEDPRSDNLYLKMLMTYVAMAQNRHNLGDVEI